MYKPSFNKREVLVFRQFKRKGYALFACLGREVVISVLSVATLSSAKAASVSDEVWRADSFQVVKEVWLDDVGVTGSRAPLTQSQAARMVTVLSREDIQAAPVQSVNDLLKYAVGVDVRQRGALGSQTDVSIRGGTQEQITVLLNGINICDPQTAHNVMELPCQLSDIVRIEVLEGPAGRIYGTSSLVGAINIVTASPASSEVQFEGGSFGYVKTAGTFHLPTMGSLSISYARSDGYSRSSAGHRNTDYSGSKAFYQGFFENDDVRIRWYAGLSDKGWGSGTFYATPTWHADEQYEHTTKIFTALQAENKCGNLYLRPSIYWNQNRDRYEGYRGRPEVMKYNYNRCNVYGVNINGYFDWSLGRTALGAELRQEDLVSGNLGEPLFHIQHISGTERDYTLGINRTNASAHLEHNVLLHRLTISAGLVAMKSSWSEADWHIYPGIDVSYRLSDHWKLFASYNSSLRLPSFTEMYYKLQGYAANPHLKPEEMQALELGAQYVTNALQAKMTLWYHHGSNMIDWIMDTNQSQDAPWQSVNHTKIDAVGIETNVAFDLQQLVSLPASIRLSYCYISQDKDLKSGIVSQYALEYLKHKFVANLHARLYRSLSLSLNLRWQDRTGQYTTFAGERFDYRPYALVDARMEWKQPRYSIYAELYNMFDNRKYVDFGNVLQPGAWLVAGATITF